MSEGMDGPQSMSRNTPLVLAVPSKGRLQENAAAFFARAGLKFIQGTGTRDYTGKLVGVPNVEVRYLSASEIANQLADGSAHLGITGEDLIRERLPDAASQVALLTPLGFGHAKVVVAVPQAWIDVRSMSDLDEVAVEMRIRHGRRLRVATKYLNLTRQFFKEKGVADYRIVESLGATEGAPAIGSAEIVVDITTTGATLAANALKIIDDGLILRSEANLVASLKADWDKPKRQAVQTVLSRIAAEEIARTTREVQFTVPPENMEKINSIIKSYELGISQTHSTVPALQGLLQCPADMAFDLSHALISAGANSVTVKQLDYIFGINNLLAEGLFKRLNK